MPTLSPDRWQEVSPYLDQALALPPEERATWAASLRVTKPALATLLQSLLEEHRVLEDESFLEHSPAPLGEQQSALAGQTVGVYTLVSPIGQGGMGSVWLAERSDGRFERRVALKFLNIALVGRGGEERFKREGKILGQLVHPQIAELLDAGVSATGQPFLALEYVDGQHIDRYCDERNLDVDARIRLFLDVLAAVKHAHLHLVVHRDIKPSNVLVATGSLVKLLDFGIAKLLEDEGQPGAATLLTREAGSALTLEYAAPEQVKGEPITMATDVYALGVLFYLLLTGQHPAGRGPHSTAELIKFVVETESPRPSDVVVSEGTEAELVANNAAARSTTPDQLHRKLGGDLDTIVLKALKKDPQERYISATRLSDDLSRYLKNEPISARPDTLAYRGGKFMRRNRVAVALATLVSAVTVIGVAGTLLQARIARKQRDAAVQERDRATRITDFMKGMFKVSDPSEARGNSVTAREILDKASKEIDTGLAKDPETQAQLMDVMGDVYESLGLYSRADPLLEHSVDIERRVHGPKNPETLKAADDLAWLLYNEGRYAEAEKLERETLDACRQVLGRDDSETLRSMRHLAATLYVEGRYAEAENMESKLLDTQRLALGPEHPETLGTIDNLALTLREEGRYAEAEKIQRELLDIRRRVLGLEHPDTLSTISGLAWTLTLDGRYAEAEKMDRELLGIRRRVLGPEHPDTLMTVTNLAWTLLQEGRYAETEKMDRELIVTERRVLGPEHPNTLRTVTSLSVALELEGRYAEAEKTQRELLAIRRRVLGTEHPSTALSAYDLSCLVARQGRRDEALSLLRQAVDHGLDSRTDLGIEKDPDFKSLHGDPRFSALVAHAKERAAAITKLN